MSNKIRKFKRAFTNAKDDNTIIKNAQNFQEEIRQFFQDENDICKPFVDAIESLKLNKGEV